MFICSFTEPCQMLILHIRAPSRIGNCGLDFIIICNFGAFFASFNARHALCNLFCLKNSYQVQSRVHVFLHRAMSDAHFTYKGSFLDQEMWFRFYQNPQFSGPLEMSTGTGPRQFSKIPRFFYSSNMYIFH